MELPTVHYGRFFNQFLEETGLFRGKYTASPHDGSEAAQIKCSTVLHLEPCEDYYRFQLRRDQLDHMEDDLYCTKKPKAVEANFIMDLMFNNVQEYSMVKLYISHLQYSWTVEGRSFTPIFDDDINGLPITNDALEFRFYPKDKVHPKGQVELTLNKIRFRREWRNLLHGLPLKIDTGIAQGIMMIDIGIFPIQENNPYCYTYPLEANSYTLSLSDVTDSEFLAAYLHTEGTIKDGRYYNTVTWRQKKKLERILPTILVENEKGWKLCEGYIFTPLAEYPTKRKRQQIMTLYHYAGLPLPMGLFFQHELDELKSSVRQTIRRFWHWWRK